MFQAVRDKVSRKGVAAAVSDALRVLRIEGDELHDRAVAYVLEGDGAQLVLELADRDTTDLDGALNRPGRVGWSWITDDLKKRIRKATSGLTTDTVAQMRGRLYAHAEVTPEQLSRLGRLLAAISEDTTIAARVPEWFGILVQDLALTRVYREDKGAVAWRPDQMESLAVAGGLRGDEVVAAVVQVLLARPRERYYGSVVDLGRYLEVPEAPAWLVARADVVDAEAARLGVEGKKELCRFVARHGVPAELRGTLARLCADTAKGVRRAADDVVSRLPDAEQVRLLAPLLETAPARARHDVVTRIAAAEGGIAAIEAALEAGRAPASDGGKRPRAGGARTAVLTKAVERARTLGEVVEEAVEAPPFEPIAEVELGPEVLTAAVALRDRQLAAARTRSAEAAEEHRKTHEHPGRQCWEVTYAERKVEQLERISDTELSHLLEIMSGRTPVPEPGDGDRSWRTAAWLSDHLDAVSAGATPLHRLRLAVMTRDSDVRLWGRLRGRLSGVTDLRVLHDAVSRAGIGNPDKRIAELVFHRWWGVQDFPVDQMWMYYAGRVEALDTYLAPRTEYEYGEAVERVLLILRHFPVLPPVLLPRLSGLATGSAKTHRASAQEVLARHPRARALAEQALTDGKSAVRASAAGWLADLGDPEGVGALRAALGKERREDVRAAFLTALEALGDDIAEHLSPAKLAAEAAQGLKKKAPVSMSWFPLDALPDLAWSDGEAVPREIPRWWVVLAVRLKEPSGEGLLARYVSLLDERSRTVLGSYVLRAWIAQDTRGPSAAESRTHAERAAQQRYDWAQSYLKQYPQLEWAQERAAIPLDEHYRRAYSEHQRTYFGSATKDKGLLALTVGMPGAELATAAQHYFKAHPQRRAQAEVLVRALAANGGRPAVQLLLAVSRQFRLRTVRECAEGLAQQLAEARGWSADQLADRTVQTAGFEDDGVLRLDFGPRAFTGRITDAFTIELRNDKGKVVRTPPSSPQGADDETRTAYKEARGRLTASRKELKAVVELQTRRLREAMTTGRTWTVEEWQEFIAGHPVMSRLAARVVWLAGPGTPQQRAFRPDDGALLGVDDEDVTLPDDGRVAVAHAVTLPGGNDGADTVEAWREHLADYEVQPLLRQLDAVLPRTAAGATRVDDRKGWLSDSLTIRGRLMGKDWKRGVAQDAGWYYEYVKEHTAVGLEAEIGFTGSFFGEENIPAAVTTLLFRKRGTYGDRGVVPLADVPPVLLAEAYADYLDVAEAGVFDPDWQKKSEY